ncbi:Manganese transport system membrane protein MntC [Elizabethkingia anophelis]|uniref:metal ABC transporter permease n=1 Tax=Elizabethkingia anophelis TaxID=1117645 RepID=UPI0021FBB414|nr:iron chelate uptake ABC transporter family permease subunit [Elizabethkingia anophelis]UTG65297.1 metal ABC transporter permease [Elizabethkingia anophelis]CAH1152374.1 Manganese transport system membrane protein MntC [Elizabethkingia anophelis]CAI9686912.1 Manganese transport system membrane protein MntC [Elizabethkingia anophelis]
MDNFINFFSFNDPNVKYVVLGSILLSVSAAIVGSFIVLKKKSLVGDAVSHSVLPGICAAFLFAGTKNTSLMLVGAFISGWLSLVTIDYITAKSKIKKDAAIGLVLSVFFALGIVLMTYIQQSGNAAQSGLDRFIFGKAATLIGSDLITFSIIAVVLMVATLAFFKEFTIIAFDEHYAQVLGLPVRKLDLLLTSLTVLAVVTGITAVGVVLMAAMLITPAAAARYWTHNIRRMVGLAAIFGALSGLAGAYISYIAPAMPTGPWMVVVSSLIAFFSFFFAPLGIVPKTMKRNKNSRTMVDENILKLFYQIGEKENNFDKKRTAEELLAFRKMQPAQLKSGLARLKKRKEVVNENQQWQLTANGLEKAKKIVRLHRLWELYLTNYMEIAPDHVHDNAEEMEHYITPELEKQLEKYLDNPDTDPHGTVIPK